MPPKKKTDKSTKATAKTKGQAVAQSVNVRVRVGDTTAKKKRRRRAAAKGGITRVEMPQFNLPVSRAAPPLASMYDGWYPPINLSRNGSFIVAPPAIANTYAPTTQSAAPPTAAPETNLPFIAGGKQEETPFVPVERNLEADMEAAATAAEYEPPADSGWQDIAKFIRASSVSGKSFKPTPLVPPPIPSTPLAPPAATPKPFVSTPIEPPTVPQVEKSERKPKLIEDIRKNITQAFNELKYNKDQKQQAIQAALGDRYVIGKGATKYTKLADVEDILNYLRREMRSSQNVEQEIPQYVFS